MAKPVVNLAEKLDTFSDHWAPRIVAQFNGHDVMIAKVQGEFVWHAHEDTDDFFLVLDGNITIETENGDIPLTKGELYVVPKGVKHRPVAQSEAHLLLIESKGTPNTGDITTAAKKIEI